MKRPTGPELRALRLRLGLTQEEIAHRVGCTVWTWSRWECDRGRPGRLAVLAIERIRVEGPALPAQNEADFAYPIGTEGTCPAHGYVPPCPMCQRAAA